ncbi:Phospholipid hydroperoxide glutathione peroxidase [Araneus ventricosus]|uniref:Glutathione peroxidase n=1 Tax=Araneus ventricosus TaxID=182803 RepID=A0A4Y2MC07_ARAVE|nr:Phospholipid hydroperoxide glutathione peroxidase [Araneus ventricosus]
MPFKGIVTFELGNASSSPGLDSLFSLSVWPTESKVVPFAANMATAPGNADWKSAKSIYDFSAIDIDGNEVSLEKYRGHVALIGLHEKYAESQGLRILGFPCNQFGGQEPGSESEIKEFIKQYNAQFDMFSKIDVNGNKAHPLWSYLKKKQGGTLGNFIKWNFTKFLIDKNGQPVKRYAPNVEPNAIEPDLLKYFQA